MCYSDLLWLTSPGDRTPLAPQHMEVQEQTPVLQHGLVNSR